MEFNHTPVLLKETIEALNLKPNAVTVDATVGGGGHSAEIAKKLKTGTLICIDQDSDAINAAQQKLSAFKQPKIQFIRSSFRKLPSILDSLEILQIDAIMADLGVSSHQIDTPSRGFSYLNDAPLDMRMNRESELTASEVVNNYPQKKLEDLIFNYGEERWARVIAAAIVKHRPIKTTLELSQIIQNSVPGAYWKKGGHPAKRTFQAIRIEVNAELTILEQFIRDAVSRLRSGGRIAIISFHSLEDRIVKQTLKQLATDCLCPPKTPVCICGHRASVKIITKKPIEASPAEQTENPRSQSAKLRVAEKL